VKPYERVNRVPADVRENRDTAMMALRSSAATSEDATVRGAYERWKAYDDLVKFYESLKKTESEGA
jgi:hypothetical protein